MPTYEAMFLLDSGLASEQFEEAEKLVLGLIDRYEGTVRISGLWDERKLAYAINGKRRGTYYMAYFDSEGNSPQQIRDDVRITPGVHRCLILRVPEDAEVPEVIEVPKAPAMVAEDERGGRRDRRRFKRQASDARCRFTRWGVKYVDWKETQTLQRLCTGQGKMFSRKRSGNTAKFQRQFKLAVKYARFMALMPYVTH